MSGREKNANKKIIIYRVLCVGLAIVLGIVLFLWARSVWVENRAEALYGELANKVNQPVETPSSDSNTGIEEDSSQEIEQEPEDILNRLGIVVPQKNTDWEELRKVNKDVYAWIYIPNTNVDYPILQHPYNDTYYLSYNLDGSRGKPGCIFTQRMNNKDFTDYNTVIYGHNMKSGAMFRTLHEFEDATFFEENPYVYIYTEDGVLVYEIFAAYETDASHILMSNDFSTKEGYAQYLKKVFSVQNIDGHFRDDVYVTTENHIVTLSTCVGSLSNKRYLVQAVLLNDTFTVQEEE